MKNPRHGTITAKPLTALEAWPLCDAVAAKDGLARLTSYQSLSKSLAGASAKSRHPLSCWAGNSLSYEHWSSLGIDVLLQQGHARTLMGV